MQVIQMSGKALTADEAADLIEASTSVSEVHADGMVAKVLTAADGRSTVLVQGVTGFLQIETALAV
jgi:hypothetical protein